MLEELQVQRLCSGEGGGGAVLLLEDSRGDNTLSLGESESHWGILQQAACWLPATHP